MLTAPTSERSRAALAALSLPADEHVRMGCKPAPMTRDQEIAWAAGLFEGEGCFSMRVERGKCAVQARLGSTDLDVVERFAQIIGVGRVYNNRRPHSPAHWKTMHEWAVGDAVNVRHVIELLLPYLGERRSEKARQVYEVALLIRPKGDHVTHCPQGHEYTEENTIIESYARNGSPRSARRCRTCHQARVREGHRRRAERERVVAAGLGHSTINTTGDHYTDWDDVKLAETLREHVTA